jgi:hypothetical protein
MTQIQRKDFLESAAGTLDELNKKRDIFTREEAILYGAMTAIIDHERIEMTNMSTSGDDAPSTPLNVSTGNSKTDSLIYNLSQAFAQYMETKSAYTITPTDSNFKAELDDLDDILAVLKQFYSILWQSASMPEERRHLTEFLNNINKRKKAKKDTFEYYMEFVRDELDGMDDYIQAGEHDIAQDESRHALYFLDKARALVNTPEKQAIVKDAEMRYSLMK